MAYSDKVWKDSPDHTTPLSAAGLNDWEARIKAETDALSLLAGRITAPSFNVRDYYPDTSGATDSATTIQAAIDAASAAAIAGGFPRVRLGGFGRGVYRIDAGLVLKPYVDVDLGDDARIVAGADLTGSGMFRLDTTLAAAVAQGTATTANGSKILTSVSLPALWTVEDRITGTGIPAGTKVVAVDVLNSKIILDAACTASATVTITKGATYYGANRNIGLFGGEVDPNGKAVGAIVRALWTENLRLEGTRLIQNRKSGDENWAWQVGGRNMSARWVEVIGGAKVYEDGFHFMHGQGLRLVGANLESGDDAIAIGGETVEANLAAYPDPIRNVSIEACKVRSLRASALKVYVVSGATGRDWEVSDVTVNGITGESGVLRNGGIWIEDYNAGVPGTDALQIKRVKINGVSLKMGSPAHDDTQGQGLHIASASDVSVTDFTAQITEGVGAATGWDLAYVGNSEDVSISGMRCAALGTRSALHIVNSNRCSLTDSQVTMTSVTVQPPVRVQNCLELDVLDNHFEGIGAYGSGQYAVGITEGTDSTVRVRGNTTRRSGASPTGYGVSIETASVYSIIVEGNDFSRLVGGLLDTAKVRAVAGEFSVRGNLNQPDLNPSSQPYGMVMHTFNRFDAIAMVTTTLREGGNGVPAGAGGGMAVFYFDPADWGKTGQSVKLRLDNIVITNAVAPTSSFAVGLYPVTVPTGGAAASVPVTLGTLVAGSQATVTAPAKETTTRAVTAEFAAPTAGYYAIGMIIGTANMAASSSVALRSRLQARAL